MIQWKTKENQEDRSIIYCTNFGEKYTHGIQLQVRIEQYIHPDHNNLFYLDIFVQNKLKESFVGKIIEAKEKSIKYSKEHLKLMKELLNQIERMLDNN